MGRLLAALARRTTSGRIIAELDGLRFVAIFVVIGSHLRYFLDKHGGAQYAGTLATNPVAAVIGRGSFGVQLFFAISGFILGMPFAAAHFGRRPRPALRAYLSRRVTRLEPPYIGALLLFFALRIVFQHADAAALAPHLLASATYSHNVLYGEPSTVLAVAWSLEVEIQFYLLVPIISWVFAIRSTRLRRVIIIAAMVTISAVRAYALATHSGAAELTVVGHLQFFLAGFLVVDLYLVDWDMSPRSSAFGDVVAFLGCAGLLLAIPDRYSASTMMSPVYVLAILFGGFRGHAFRWFLRQPAISVIGGMCYSIYLLHFPLITSVGTAFDAWVPHGKVFVIDFIALAAICVPAILVVSTLYFVAIERPCMARDWPQRLWRAMTRSPAAQIQPSDQA